MDSSASAHLSAIADNLQYNLKHNISHSVIVDNGSNIPVTCVGSSILHTSSKPLKLNDVLVAPKIFKSLISVRKFTTYNWCTVEFDSFSFFVKDLPTRTILLRCDSFGDIYSLPATLNKTLSNSTLWHKRLAHTNNTVLHTIFSSNSGLCNKDQFPTSCQPCYLGKQIKLFFYYFQNYVIKPFDIVHSDVLDSLLCFIPR